MRSFAASSYFVGCCLLLTAIATQATAAETNTKPLQLELLLKPHTTAGVVDYVEGRMTLEQPKIAGGGKLLRMPLVIVSIPTARYDGDAVQASDSNGALPLTQKDEE